MPLKLSPVNSVVPMLLISCFGIIIWRCCVGLMWRWPHLKVTQFQRHEVRFGWKQDWCTVLRTPFNWAAMSPLMQTKKDLCFWYYHILLEHINYFIYKSLMKLSLDASHFGKVIRRENQVLMELQSTKRVKTDGDKYNYKVASVKSQGVQLYCLKTNHSLWPWNIWRKQILIDKSGFSKRK